MVIKRKVTLDGHSCLVKDCGELTRYGDAYFCALHRKEWMYFIELIEVDDIALQQEVLAPLMKLFTQHNAERCAMALQKESRNAGYESYLHMLASLSEKKLKRGG